MRVYLREGLALYLTGRGHMNGLATCRCPSPLDAHDLGATPGVVAFARAAACGFAARQQAGKWSEGDLTYSESVLFFSITIGSEALAARLDKRAARRPTAASA